MIKKILVSITMILMLAISFGNTANAESLFVLGANANYAGSPKSLFSGVQARQIGDLISIIMSESITINDNLNYSTSKSSTTTDAFTSFLKDWFKLSFLKGSDGYGGSNEVESNAQGNRTFSYGDTIAVQVVQQMPNGNLSVQGKKTLVNGNERMDLIVTGLVDPRWIDQNGRVYSYNVANLQFALSGRGAISRSQNEGIFNRVIKYLF